MSISKINEADDASLRERIEDLERKVNELAGGRMSSWKSDELTPEIHEEFLRNIIEYETAPWTTHQQQLQEAGIELPSPEDLDDEQLKAKLWEVIEVLAKLRVFLQCTNHLSDRELYAELWGDLLLEEVKAVPYDEDRKSTRLNSSHLGISYAVFCLKKKMIKINKVSICTI